MRHALVTDGINWICPVVISEEERVIALRGDVDRDPRGLRRELQEPLSEGQVSIVVDMGELTFINGAALEALVDVQRRARRSGADIRLRSVPSSTRSILRITGLLDLFELEP